MSFRPRAFSLIELLIVMTIILLLAVLAIPAFNSFGRANALIASGRSLVDVLNLARQTAVTRSLPVEVRFYKLPDTESGAPTDFRGVQLFVVDGANTNSLTRGSYFSQPIVISPLPAATSLWDDESCPEMTPGAQDVKLPRVGMNYRYRQFSFRPDGSTDLPSDRSWFLTLCARNEGSKRANGLPDNFFTVQIDPQNGRTKTFQP